MIYLCLTGLLRHVWVVVDLFYWNPIQDTDNHSSSSKRLRWIRWTITFCFGYNINWRDVQRKNVVNNVDKSSLRAPCQKGPYTNKHTEQHKTRRTYKPCLLQKRKENSYDLKLNCLCILLEFEMQLLDYVIQNCLHLIRLLSPLYGTVDTSYSFQTLKQYCSSLLNVT